MLALFKGQEAADNLTILMGVEEAWLQAGFTQIDTTWGSFNNYVENGLQLDADDIQRLRENLLE